MGGTERILLVDDEAMVLELGGELLSTIGYRVEAFISGELALERFKAAPDEFDIVITDQTMPIMAGDELAKQIRAICPDIPVILCSGYSDALGAQERESLGRHHLVTKPYSVETINATIRKALEECG